MSEQNPEKKTEAPIATITVLASCLLTIAGLLMILNGDTHLRSTEEAIKAVNNNTFVIIGLVGIIVGVILACKSCGGFPHVGYVVGGLGTGFAVGVACTIIFYGNSTAYEPAVLVFFCPVIGTACCTILGFARKFGRWV